MYLKVINNYFLILFSIIPISMILGSTISLINILLIDVSFLFFIIYLKDFSFFKHSSVRYLLILYIYLIFNSIISVDQSIGLSRNLGFIRVIILFVAINYFFKDKKFLQKVIYVWTGIILVVLIDVCIESFTGKNIFGYGSLYGRRIVSFFKDEPVVGGFLNSFYLISIGFLHMKFSENFKNRILIFSILFLIVIFLTGERSNSIKALLGLFLFYTFFNQYKFKEKFLLFLGSIILLTGTIFASDFLKMRYVYQIKNLTLDNQIYFNQYKSAYKIFKENILFGVGNKNYRIVACSKFEEEAEKWIDIIGKPSELTGSYGYEADFFMNNYIEYKCNTHPHQIYFEFLSEHGIIGMLLIFYLMYKLIFARFIFQLKNLNYLQLGSGFYLILIFLPLIPSGAFFSDFSITLFALNISIFYASNSNFNIFLFPNEKNRY